jgi:hypothetical protein
VAYEGFFSWVYSFLYHYGLTGTIRVALLEVTVAAPFMAVAVAEFVIEVPTSPGCVV